MCCFWRRERDGCGAQLEWFNCQPLLFSSDINSGSLAAFMNSESWTAGLEEMGYQDSRGNLSCTHKATFRVLNFSVAGLVISPSIHYSHSCSSLPVNQCSQETVLAIDHLLGWQM